MYCKDRFGYGRDSADLKILAAAVVDEISKMPTIRRQKMPTTLEQVRYLTKLQPDEQREVWQQAVEQAGGRVPSGRAVKSIVERLKERDTTPSPIPYQVGQVVEIRAGSNSKLRKHDGCWGIVTHVGTWICTVHISVRNVDLQCKADDMDKIDDRYTAEIRAVNERITALMQRDDLSRTAIAVLETLVQQTCFSSDDLWFLEKVEERYETDH